MGALTKDCGEIKVVISLEALLFYIYHYHSINHKDGISCLQLERRRAGGSKAIFFQLYFSCRVGVFPYKEKSCTYFPGRWSGEKVNKCGRGRKKEWAKLLHHKQAHSSSISPLVGWTPWALTSVTVTGPHEQWLRLSLSVSLYRLTRGLVGPAGNVWVQRGPSPRKKVAPQSLPTSWETPMPLVSPPALSCRIHVSSPSSESHTSWPVSLVGAGVWGPWRYCRWHTFYWKRTLCVLLYWFV